MFRSIESIYHLRLYKEECCIFDVVFVVNFYMFCMFFSVYGLNYCILIWHDNITLVLMNFDIEKKKTEVYTLAVVNIEHRGGGVHTYMYTVGTNRTDTHLID